MVILAPYIHESGEAETAQAEEVLAAPDRGELHGNLGRHSHEILVQELEVQRILKITAVQEPVDAGEERAVHGEGAHHIAEGAETAVVLHLEAERCETGVTPEVQAARNLEVSVARRDNLVSILVVVVIVDEEEGVTPLVGMETFKGRGEVLATKIVESLEVGLSACCLGQRQCSYRCDENS